MYLFALRDLSFIYVCALTEFDDRAKFQEEIVGSHNSYVVSLTFTSSKASFVYLLTKVCFNGIRRVLQCKINSMYLLYKICIYLHIFVFNCNYFLLSVFCFSYQAKKEECPSRYMRAVDSLRFCKFYREIPIMRIARITVLSKITKSSACNFLLAIYGNSPLGVRGILKSESHCRY